MNWEKIAWEYNTKKVELNIEKGTLLDDFISLDGEFLILTFHRNSSQYSAPCNAVVYNREGQLVHHLCAPNLSNTEMIENHKGTPEMKGRFVRTGIYEFKGKMEFMIGIEYTELHRPSAQPYSEARSFDPVTGEIGELLKWNLPWR